MSKKPSILFIFSDQQRPDTMGCYGQRLPVTPNLDALAAEGVRFENAFTCQPVCGPARASLQTGKYATQTGCFRNDIALPETERTMAHLLSEAGYEVGYVGKWHLASTGARQNYRAKPVPPHLRGGYRDFWVASDVLEFTSHSYDGHMFDADGRRRDFPPGCYRADAVTDFALKFLRTRNHDRPFFLFISYVESHHQNDHNRYEGPEGSKERFKDYDVPGDLDTRRASASEKGRPSTFPSAGRLRPRPVGAQGDWRENYPDYLGCCHALDANVGRLVAELRAVAPTAPDTLLIYTSDHGSHFRTRNSEYKRSCHEASIHIPLVIHGPGFVGGKMEQRLVSLLDLTPTVLRAAGVEPPAYMAGRPLQDLAPYQLVGTGLVTGRAADWREAVFVHISEDHIGRAVRTKKWKYSVWVPYDKPGGGSASPGSDVYTEQCLYDLESDPFEKRNLVADPAFAAVRQELAATLKRLMAEAGERVPEILPAGT